HRDAGSRRRDHHLPTQRGGGTRPRGASAARDRSPQGRVSATLAHELRNPLAPLVTSLDYLDRIDSTALEAVGARAIMRRQLAQLVRLVDDLLDVSRITRGRLDLRRQRVELAN